MPVFLRMFTSSEAVIELGVRYSVVAFAFTLIVTVSMAFEKLFQAVGNMKTTMISLMCGCITNIVLDPVLIFGYGLFPEMGIEGAALATGIGQTLTLAIYLVVYLVRPIRVHIRRQYILPSKKMVIKLYSIGIPATLNLALPSLLISALNAILAAYSEVYILVLGIYYKLQTFIYLPANCSATSFLRNWDSILEKKRANLRSISEPARLRQPPPRSTGAAHARGRAQSIREERRIAAPPVLFALLWVRLLPALYGPFCGPLRPFGGCPWGVTPPARECLPPAPPDTRRRG